FTLLVAMAVFFVKSKPQEQPELQDIVSVEEETQPPADESVETPNPQDLIENDETEIGTELEETDEVTSDVKTVSAPSESTGEFTSWMTPLALDTYIRHKNRGYSESFWQRGHWITAVEGRWTDDGHEFRIALDKIPDLNQWQWQYRVNQSTGQFANASRDFADQGFKLVHSQTFTDPNGKTKFQAVWQRELSESAPVAETRTSGAPDLSAPQPLDVNNLRFR
ncbi:MAG: hypothetical protein AAF357_12530, partial [Verrucomicrobiota bacterium]